MVERKGGGGEVVRVGPSVVGEQSLAVDGGDRIRDEALEVLGNVGALPIPIEFGVGPREERTYRVGEQGLNVNFSTLGALDVNLCTDGVMVLRGGNLVATLTKGQSVTLDSKNPQWSPLGGVFSIFDDNSLVQFSLTNDGKFKIACAREAEACEVVGVELVPRREQIISIGDLGGSLDKFWKSLKEGGAVDANGKWNCGAATVVFHGDFLADRKEEGLKILAEIIRLKDEAKAVGGKVELIAGNHDWVMLEFLMGSKIVSDLKKTHPLLESQFLGLFELVKFNSASGKTADFERTLETLLTLDRKEILRNMLRDPEGKKLLEAMCEFCLFLRHGDVIFLHQDLTERMTRSIDPLYYKKEVCNGGVDQADVNTRLQAILRKCFVDEIDVDDFDRKSIRLHKEIFFSNLRTCGGDEISGLSATVRGFLQPGSVKAVVFGHTWAPWEKKKLGAVNFVSIDRRIDGCSVAISGPNGILAPSVVKSLESAA